MGNQHMKNLYILKLSVLAMLMPISNSAVAQSIPAPWLVTVKGSYDIAKDAASYTYKFTNISGKPQKKSIRLGWKCDYFNAPLLREVPWNAYHDAQSQRTNHDCEVIFGKSIGTQFGTPRSASPTPYSSIKVNSVVKTEDSSGIVETKYEEEYINPNSYRTSNGWLASLNYYGRDVPGSDLYSLDLQSGSVYDEAKQTPVGNGQSFEFVIYLDGKDPNYLLTNYVVFDSLDVAVNSKYRAYPITAKRQH
jgi:hypothetical protein